LPPAQARRVADTVAAQLAREYGIQAQWHGNTLHFERTGVSGTLRIAAKELLIDVSLGFLLMAFRDAIAQAIERNLDQHLGAASAGENLPRS
jgi:putative polyhydroxyalkanoate system protein